MNRELREIGIIPVTTSIIESFYHDLKSSEKKVVWLEKNGYIIRLKRGLYVVNPEYDYKYISREAFAVGVRTERFADYAFLIASPEKALCDLIANSSKVNLRYMKDVENYLENDIRMDMEEFMKFDPRVLEEYIKVGKKADSIATLLKYLTR